MRNEGLKLQELKKKAASNIEIEDDLPFSIEVLTVAQFAKNAHSVSIEVPDSKIVERITGRRNDPVTGAIYHLKFNPPPADVVDRLQQRKDDTEEACRVRLGKYHAETAPVIPFYDDKGLLKRVDGDRSPAEVKDAVMSLFRGSNNMSEAS